MTPVSNLQFAPFCTAIKRDNFFLDAIESYSSFNGRTVEVCNTIRVDNVNYHLGIEIITPLSRLSIAVRLVLMVVSLGTIALIGLILKGTFRLLNFEVMIHPSREFNEQAYAIRHQLKTNRDKTRPVLETLVKHAKNLQAGDHSSLPELDKDLVSIWLNPLPNNNFDSSNTRDGQFMGFLATGDIQISMAFEEDKLTKNLPYFPEAKKELETISRKRLQIQN